VHVYAQRNRISIDLMKKEQSMKPRYVLASVFTALALVTTTGCSVMRDQETTGAYVDDTVVTTRVKTKFAQDSTVSAMAISVETLKGVVQLSGFAKSSAEKEKAEELARSVNGVVSVRNDIVVRA
jgi:hyperosmotically inducible periplasmic protein